MKDGINDLKNYYGIEKSKAAQLQELKEKKVKESSGWIRYLPKNLQKFGYYFKSLKLSRKPDDFKKTMGITLLFTMITSANSARSGLIYFFLGQMIILSSLLCRNMPQRKEVGRNAPVANWSKNAFQTAAALTLLLAGSSFASTFAIVSIFGWKLPVPVRAKMGMIVSMLFTGYNSCFFEVFEEKNKNGWRWAKALDNALPKDLRIRLNEEVYGKTRLYDMYDYEYDPQVDDYPRGPRFFGENIPLKAIVITEEAAQTQYEKWFEDRKNARRPPIEKATDKMLGAKEGFMLENVPKTVQQLVQLGLKQKSKWYKLPAKVKPLTIEFSPLPGPKWFRDKRPDWMTVVFGKQKGIWELRNTRSKAAASGFGSYRRTMYKQDPSIVLQPYDT